MTRLVTYVVHFNLDEIGTLVLSTWGPLSGTFGNSEVPYVKYSLLEPHTSVSPRLETESLCKLFIIIIVLGY